ncbi:hypothetical protein MMC07_007920 [Pseudocyphellaria aurata]|nr:hypothetical protein [Pseudocyphellaria aurata]
MFFRLDFFTFFLVISALTSVAFGAPLNDIPSSVLAEPVNNTHILEARAPAQFTHPGVLIDLHQLETIRTNVKAGREPWSKSFSALRTSKFAKLGRKPSPWKDVYCGFYDKPSYGCSDERRDALSAYAAALAWYTTNNKVYAQQAIRYMNAWAGTLRTHGGPNNGIQTGWAGASWARAAEIIRYTHAGWASKDIKAFEKMLRTIYLPVVIKGSKNNGNWELVMMEAAQGISVFLNDHASYDEAMNKFLHRVPAYIYLRSDGPYPKVAPPNNLPTRALVEEYWHGQSNFWEDGLAQETCRDFSHLGSGLSSIAHVSETSHIQGHDLYQGDVGYRLRHALEFHTRYQTGASNLPAWLCGGKVKKGLGPVTEVGFNALAVRLRHDMPHTKVWTKENRPAYTNWLDAGFETLSHAKGPL